MKCPNCGNTMVHVETMVTSAILTVEIYICRSCGSRYECYAPPKGVRS